MATLNPKIKYAVNWWLKKPLFEYFIKKKRAFCHCVLLLNTKRLEAECLKWLFPCNLNWIEIYTAKLQITKNILKVVRTEKCWQFSEKNGPSAKTSHVFQTLLNCRFQLFVSLAYKWRLPKGLTWMKCKLLRV